MDTSETYIKMCEKAEEIQKAEPLDERGDSLPHQFFAGEWGIYKEDDGYYYMGGKEKCIWLPRQDQLQEMLYEKIGSRGFILISYFVDQMHKGALDNSQMELTSMEQLWLAFVMKEKYNKVWTGEEWRLVENEVTNAKRLQERV